MNNMKKTINKNINLLYLINYFLIIIIFILILKNKIIQNFLNNFIF